MKDVIQSRTKAGRPLSFDRDMALEKAMLLFWRNGYDASSLSDLTAAMGVTPPSLYAAFGNKQKLFLEALDRYLARPDADLRLIFDKAPTARDAIQTMLAAATFHQTRHGKPHGCMLMSAATRSPLATEVQKAMIRLRATVESWIEERIKRGIREGDVSSCVDAAALAAYCLTIIQGMSTQARDGASRTKLESIADAAMAAWPAD